MDEKFKYDLKEKDSLEKKEGIEPKENDEDIVAYQGERKLISNADKDILAHYSSKLVTAVFTAGAVALLIYCIVAKLGFLIILPACLLLVLIPLTILSFISYSAAKKKEKSEYSYFSNLETDMKEHILKIEKTIRNRESIKLVVIVLLVFTIFAAPIVGSISIVNCLSKNPGKIPIFGIVCVAYFVLSLIAVFIYSAFSKRKFKAMPESLVSAQGAVYSCIVLSETNGKQSFLVRVAVMGVDRFLAALSENIRYEKGQYVKIEYDAANLGVCKIVD